MAISINTPELSEDAYKKLRRALIEAVELKAGGDPSPTPYFDTEGNIIIGIGFNMQPFENRKKVMEEMGLSKEQKQKIDNLFDAKNQPQGYKDLQAIRNSSDTASVKNAKLAKLFSDTIGIGRSFSLTDSETTSIFDYFADQKDQVAQNATGVILRSKERAALTSLYYCSLHPPGHSKSMLGPSLLNALKNIGDPAEARAEAWYQIRYNSGEYYQRRYIESEIFGLFKDPDNIQKEDALGAYRVYTNHRIDKPGKEMTKEFDAKHATAIKDANSALEQIGNGVPGSAKTLWASLLPAAEVLKDIYIKEEYDVTIDFDPLNIQVAGDKARILRGENDTSRTEFMDDLLIGDYDDGVFLYGYSGNDLLIGGKGEDILNGGTDADTLVGGAGQDNMFGGDGDDTFIIEGTDTAYDTFNGGEGNGDKILGGAGDDTIRLHHFTGEDRVEIIDGGGGENNIIEGTIGDDIFDFTGVVLRNIKEIRGGGGNDTYIVNHGGGEGPVTIEDKDGENRVLLDGEVLSLLIKKADGTYYSPNKVVTADLVGNEDLRVVGKNGSVVILNEDFQEGDFGINIIDELTIPTILDPEIDGITKHGDLKPVEFRDANNNIYYKYDENNNIIVHADQSESGRNDTLYGTGAGDYLLGHAGNDNLQGKAGNDWLEGGSGTDTLSGNEGDDLLLGGEGNDSLNGGVGNDHVEGGSGEDTLVGDAGSDLLFGGEDKDRLFGGADNDLVDGGSGNDFVKGDAGDDILVGGTESDRLFGGSGNDQLFAEEQKDMAILLQEGETGSGTGARGDLLGDEEGDDLLLGGAGNDVLMGGAGADGIYGGAGDDVIEGDFGLSSAYSSYTYDDWSVEKTVTLENDITVYRRNYLRLFWQEAAVDSQGGDTIFAGAGNDHLNNRITGGKGIITAAMH